MLDFYRKAITIFFILLLVTSILALLCFNRVFVRQDLLPAHDSVLRWQFKTITDVQKGGTSSIVVNESKQSIDYDYVLTQDVQYPHVTAVIAFAELENAKQLVDLSMYSHAILSVKCTPRNLLSIHLHSFDPVVTRPDNFSTYRIAEFLASCTGEWSEVAVDLRYLNVPAWWLQTYNQETSDQQYLLDQVIALSIGTSRQGPINTSANIKIGKLTLRGLDWRYVWIFIGLTTASWLAFVWWLFRYYTQSLIGELTLKLEQDRPLMAYQQLSIEPHKDKEKSAVLRFMATEYANPELSLDMAIASLGINRTKINEILKEELGYTFNAYYNKLRLAEAARLLSEKGDVNVAEIAYAVGYNNVSYFNKLFKNEYGCTPKTFKGMYQANKLG